MEEVLGRQKMTRTQFSSRHSSRHSFRSILGRPLFWLAALLTLFLTACAVLETPSQPVTFDPPPLDSAQSDPARADSQTIIPASDASGAKGIVSANSEVEPTPQAEYQPASESAEPAPKHDPQPVSALTPLLNVADTVEKARPAVVSIVAEARIQGVYGDVFSVFGNGTGVIFDPKGLVLTNTHVVDRATTITVTRDDGTQEVAKIIGADPMSDLAVLQLPGSDYPYLPLNSGASPRVGDWVIAIGNALALPGGPTVTVGVVSALGRSLDVGPEITLYNLIQTDTVMNPGSSGGPLLNLNGELVGINTAVQRFSQGGTRVEGLGFAINMETANLISDQILELGRVRWSWMGAFLNDLDPKLAAEVGLPIREGVVVLKLFESGPSHKAGIQRGDIILSMNGHKVGTTRVLTRLLRQEFKPGQKVQVELFRDGTKLTLPLVLKERPRA